MSDNFIFGMVLFVVFFLGAIVGSSFISDDKPQVVIKDDSVILQARNYVADYEMRMAKVSEDIKLCLNKFSDQSTYRDCRATVYDVYGFEYNGNRELASSVTKEYAEKKSIAFYPLTTEKE